MYFGQKLSELLGNSCISPRELSVRTGVSVDAICFFLIGKRKPSLTLAILIAEVLDVTAEDLLTDEEIREAAVGDIVKLNDGQKTYLRRLLAKFNRRIPTMKELRGCTGLSQEKFALKYGVPLHMLRVWEAGQEDPPAQKMAALSGAVNKDYFLPKDLLNGGNGPVRRKKWNITFDRKELFVLEVVNHLNRSDAFVQVQELIRCEPNQDMLNAKQNVLLKLAAMTDGDYRSIDTKKCFEGWCGVPSPDGFYDFENELRGIMSEDGEILRDPLPGEAEIIESELRVMGVPPYSDDWRDP